MADVQLINNDDHHGKIKFVFIFNDFKISRAIIDFLDYEIETSDIEKWLGELIERIDFLISNLREDKSDIKNKEQLLSIFNSKKNRIIDYRKKFREEKTEILDNYNYYSEVLKQYEEKSKKLINKNDEIMILNSSRMIQEKMYEDFYYLLKDYETFCYAYEDEKALIDDYIEKFNY